MNAAALRLREAVYGRSLGMDDLSGDWVAFDGAWSPHHRRLKSRGGPDSLANLLLLSDRSHRAVHASPAWSYARGFLIPNGFSPDGYAVFRRCGWYLPGDVWTPVHPDSTVPPKENV